MKTLLVCVASAKMLTFSFAADADLAAISTAAQKLAEQSSYQWKTTMRAEGSGPFGGAPNRSVRKDGYLGSWTSPQNSFEFARKADGAAVVLVETG
jgi:hypothetical protein